MGGAINVTFGAARQWRGLFADGDHGDRVHRAIGRAVLHVLRVRDGRHPCRCYTSGLPKTVHIFGGVWEMIGTIKTFRISIYTVF